MITVMWPIGGPHHHDHDGGVARGRARSGGSGCSS